MPRYIRSIKYNEDYPDVPLVGHSVVYIANLPDELAEDSALSLLEQEINNIASKAGEAFHNELVVKAYARKGSLVADIFFNCDLPTLLSVENLKAMGVYIPNEVIQGVKAGTVIYTTALTYKAIRRLERGMSKICIMLKNYIMVRASASSSIISGRKKKNNESKGRPELAEGRSGVLGVLSKLYDAVGVCKSTSGIDKKRNAIVRVRNAINTLDDVITAHEDRIFLCYLLTPLIQQIPDTAKLDDSKSQKDKKLDIENYSDYKRHKKEINERMSLICHFD